jgi:hypothetical protein
MAAASGCLALRDLRYDDERIAGLFLPRTRTYLLLQALGLPLLSGFIALSDDEASLSKAVSLMTPYGARAIVRSDPMKPDATTIRGGDIWPLTELGRAAKKYLSLGRALVLLEPYERTANEWSFSILGGLQGRSFILEVLGPGFDSGHLNRGQITPHETFTGELLDRTPRLIAHSEFDRGRYAQDLARVGSGRDASLARPLPDSILRTVLQYFARVEEVRTGMFVLSGAVLQPGERLVFWDLYDPSQQNR